MFWQLRVAAAKADRQLIFCHSCADPRNLIAEIWCLKSDS